MFDFIKSLLNLDIVKLAGEIKELIAVVSELAVLLGLSDDK